jgi:hypothetical protein
MIYNNVHFTANHWLYVTWNNFELVAQRESQFNFDYSLDAVEINNYYE